MSAIIEQLRSLSNPKKYAHFIEAMKSAASGGRNSIIVNFYEDYDMVKELVEDGFKVMISKANATSGRQVWKETIIQISW